MPSFLQQLRMEYQPTLPKALQDLKKLAVVPGVSKAGHLIVPEQLVSLFPKTAKQSFVTFSPNATVTHTAKRVGVVLSGGQAAGGHNVICGLFDALRKLHPDSKLFGFSDGPKGIIENTHRELTAAELFLYRNQGGFDLIGSGRTKIETPAQFQAAEATVRELDLDGLVIIGGDDSNTNAAMLAEYFLAHGCKTRVIGVPKTIDGDLRNNDIEMSFGFDTAVKIYSEIIGNILRDNLSAKKSHYFIKLMGRSASHIALECALQTHPNLALIGEEVAAQGKTLMQITAEISDMICSRSAEGKDYAVTLIPEGIIEFIPEFKHLITELNSLMVEDKPHLKKIESMASKQEKIAYMQTQLSAEAARCFQSIPFEVQVQLLLDRDPHGNVQVSKIETERLFIEMVRTELALRKKAGKYSGKFSPQPLFCGYEGRSGMPSNFDAQYCYALGHVAALLVDSGLTGYIACVQNLARPVEEWKIGARPLVTMFTVEMRAGKLKPVIEKYLVNLQGQLFQHFSKLRKQWLLSDDYCYPGPIQFFGPRELTEAITFTLALPDAK